jgi:Family of unknown function (DUF5329)
MIVSRRTSNLGRDEILRWWNVTRQFKLILIFAFTLASGGLSFVQAQTLPNTEKQKIEALIKQIANLRDAKFVRNGSAYNADSAATFLRRKWGSQRVRGENRSGFHR